MLLVPSNQAVTVSGPLFVGSIPNLSLLGCQQCGFVIWKIKCFSQTLLGLSANLSSVIEAQGGLENSTSS